jgi:HK97 family phage major capsid protein
MQQMMDDPKIAADIISNGQLSEFTRAYAKATDERGEMSELIVNAVQAAMVGKGEINDQVDERVKTTLAAMLKDVGVNRPQMGGPGEGAKLAATYNKLAPGAAMDEIGFANIGDFARVAFNKGRRDDPRGGKVVEVMNTYSSNDPASAGFLLPEQVRSEVMELALEQSIIRPRASIMQMTGLKQVVPFVDETTHVGSVFGGMTFSWTPESGTISASEAKFGRVMLEAWKLTGLARVPNELWADAPALSAFLMRSIPRGIAFTEDAAFIAGNGTGQPLGVQSVANTALVTVAKETNQPANTILVENILKMYARLLPQSIGSSVWLASPSTFPQLMQLSIAVGTGGAPVALVDIHATPTMTLLGRPLILTEKVPALSTAGDIGLYDFSFYMVGDRQSVALESSEHSRFANDETELRAILRVDGRPWIQSPLTPANGGDSLSPFVVLGAR